MSKIILSFGTLGPGGAARVCANLSYPLTDKYDDVILVTWADHTQFYEYDKRARWYCVEKETGGTNDYKRMKWFRNLVKIERPDLILSFLEPWNLRVLVCTIGLGVKTIVAERNDPHGVNKYWIMDQIEKFVYRRAHKILVQTETIKKFFTGRLESRTSVIYNPVNLSKEMVGEALRTSKTKRIVSVARLKPQKNLDILIDAFSHFVASHPDYTLTIYGEGPLKEQLELHAERLGIGDKVFLPGPSKKVHQEILDADMMCLVSSREGMSNAMIEAMCLGLPCICTKVSGAIDLIKNGENGLLVDVGDISMLIDSMNYLVDNPVQSKFIGEKAKELYKIVNKERIYLEWMEFLDNALKE